MPINTTKYEVPENIDTSLMIGDIHAFITHLSRPEIRKYLYIMAIIYTFEHFRIKIDAVAKAHVDDALAADSRYITSENAPSLKFLAELALDLRRKVPELLPLRIFPPQDLIQSLLDKYFEQLK